MSDGLLTEDVWLIYAIYNGGQDLITPTRRHIEELQKAEVKDDRAYFMLDHRPFVGIRS